VNDATADGGGELVVWTPGDPEVWVDALRMIQAHIKGDEETVSAIGDEVDPARLSGALVGYILAVWEAAGLDPQRQVQAELARALHP
jgi:hypothetical protein